MMDTVLAMRKFLNKDYSEAKQKMLMSAAYKIGTMKDIHSKDLTDKSFKYAKSLETEAKNIVQFVELNEKIFKTLNGKIDKQIKKYIGYMQKHSQLEKELIAELQKERIKNKKLVSENKSLKKDLKLYIELYEEESKTNMEQLQKNLKTICRTK